MFLEISRADYEPDEWVTASASSSLQQLQKSTLSNSFITKQCVLM